MKGECQANGTVNHDKDVFSVVVVGGGLGGLAAAVSIARAGHTVTVVEAASKLDEVSTSPKCFSTKITRKDWRWYQYYPQFGTFAATLGLREDYRWTSRGTRADHVPSVAEWSSCRQNRSTA